MPAAAPSPAPPRSWPVFRSLAGYNPAWLGGDLGAGLTLAAIAIPEQMATARLGGFTPEAGFAAFIAGSCAFAVMGGSRFLSAGADSTITPIFASGLVLLTAAGTPDYARQVALLALMVGALVMAGGLFRLGWIADLLSVPVTTGFMAGIAVHIAASQLPAFLGVAVPDGNLVQRLCRIALSLGHANPAAAALGIGVLAATVAAERISPRIPGALIGLVAATLCVAAFGLERHSVAVLGPLAGGLPAPVLPPLGIEGAVRLLPLALMVALVVMVQTAATTRGFPSAPDQPVDVNRDYLGIGAGSLLAGLIGAFPVNASPPRTGIAAATGGRSQVTGLVAAAIVSVLAMYGMGLLAHVPYAGLAGILLFVAGRLVRVPALRSIFGQTREEFLLVIATTAAIVVLPIQNGVAVGIILSLVHGMWTTTRAGTLELERVPGTTIWWPPTPGHPGETLPGVCVIAFQGPLSFLNADAFSRGVMRAVERRAVTPQLLVLEGSSIAEIDYTAALAFTALIRRFQAAGTTVAVARLESVRARAACERFGIVGLLGESHFFHSVDEAVHHCCR
jgi:MFS superfamily sulfate permease-like transporter